MKRAIVRAGSGIRSRFPTERTRREGGAVLLMVAFSMVVLIVATSLTIDIGTLSAKRRDLQKTADDMALDMLRYITPNTKSAQLVTDANWIAAAQASAQRNGLTSPTFQCQRAAPPQTASPNDSIWCYDRDDFPPGATYPKGPVVTISVGHIGAAPNQYCDTSTTSADGTTCFIPSSSYPGGPSDPPTAVRVTAQDTVKYFFSTASRATSRSAVTAQGPAQAWFRVGSFLASLDPNTDKVLGQLLNQVLPGAAALSYSGVVRTSVTVGALQTYLPVTVGSPDQLLDTMVSMHDLVVASIGAVQAGSGDSAALTALNGLLSLAPTAPKIRLGDILGVDAGGSVPAADVSLNLGQLLLSSVFLADSDHFINVPNTGLSIPGLTSVGVGLTVTEAPRIGGPNEGASVTTKQLQLTVTPNLNLSSANSVNACNIPPAEQSLLATLLGGLFQVLGCLLGPVLKSLTIGINGSVPITVTGAKATVTQHIDCTNKRLVLTPSELSAATVNAPIHFDITLGSGVLAGVDFTAGAKANGTSSPLTFNALGPGPNQYTSFSPGSGSFGSSPLGLKNLLQLQGGSVTLLNASLPITFSLLQGAIMPLVNQALGLVDQYVVTPLAQLLGMNLAGATVWPLKMDCQPSTPVLYH
jgi:uncharacterized membrane protein